MKAPILSLDDDVLERAAQLRQLKRMGLGDSLIAGTALHHDLVLVTHNIEDFQWVEGLEFWTP